MASEVSAMKKERRPEKTWEVKDPKPPVIQSGHLENQRRNETPS